MARDPSVLVQTLEDHRLQLAAALVPSLAGWDKYPDASSLDWETRHTFIQAELLVFIDYLALALKQQDHTFRDLYIGEKLKQCYYPPDTPEQARERRQRILDQDRAALLTYLAPLLTEQELAPLAALLDDIARVVRGEGKRKIKVLFVGDCLHLDVVAFLAAPLAEHGFHLDVTFATSKAMVELQRSLRALQGRSFDLVFFSPFSYSFHVGYSGLRYLHSAVIGEAALNAVLDGAKADTLAIMRLLGALFEAPIFVHNSAGVRRHNGSLPQQFKTALTQRTRARARRSINAWLPAQLAALNQESFTHFFLLDEAKLLSRYSENQLGRRFYEAQLQHPAALGRAIAALYLDAIIAVSVIMPKKVVITAVDELLRDPAGPDSRQRILKRLRNKGMLLALNGSRPATAADWAPAGLTLEDFVSVQHNSDSKVQNLQRLADELNLKAKDFLLLDGHAEEREAVAASLPEITTLDGDANDVWQRLSLAAELLPEHDELDRTLAYRQRAERQVFLEDTTAAAEQQETFRNLQFRVIIRAPQRKELKRVSELINRTNQFNLCGTRTTLAEVTRWFEDGYRNILLVEAHDKFGSMGTVCVAVTVETAEQIRIPVFVLSCRVFGFGVETALLNHLKRNAGFPAAGKPIVGLYLETPFNEPCSHTYAEHAFQQQGHEWVYRGGGDLRDPEWLTVEDLLPERA